MRDSEVMCLICSSAPYDAVPDRQTGIRGWCELRSISPTRQWNFVEVNVLADELHQHHNQVPYVVETVGALAHT
jgi:hypothetical protein